MRVLVTRPERDAQETAARLIARGHSALIAPLLGVRFAEGGDIALDGVKVLLATSVNGVRALARRTERRDVALFAVGRQTAAAARKLGFGSVRNADGDVTALAEAVRRSIDPKAGRVLHVAGDDAAGTLVETLIASGYDASRVVLYSIDAAASLPDELATALKSAALDAVLNFSARSASIFRTCVVDAGLGAACAPLVSACISRASAEALKPLRFRELRIAAAPNQDALLDCLD
jgi:uroporphyrinogen-III synthase